MLEDAVYFLWDGVISLCWPVLLLIVATLAVRQLWKGWKAAHSWQEEHKRAKLETERLRMNIELVTVGGALVDRRDLRITLPDLIRLEALRIDANRTHAPVPHSIHIARIDPPQIAQIEQQPAPAVTVEPRDLWQLYTADLLPDNGFLLGHNLITGEPVIAGWKQLYSALVGGKSGSGKSTLIRSVLVQSALQDGRFVVLDRHYGAGEESLGASLQPLRSLMPFDVAANERQMVDALRYVLDVGRKRIAGDPDRTPLIMVVDETTALFQRSDIAGEMATVHRPWMTMSKKS